MKLFRFVVITAAFSCFSWRFYTMRKLDRKVENNIENQEELIRFYNLQTAYYNGMGDAFRINMRMEPKYLLKYTVFGSTSDMKTEKP